MVVTTKQKIVVLCLCMLCSASCSSQESDENKVVFMVLDSCKDFAINYFKNLDPDTRIRFTYHNFDYDFESHPEVAGYMELTSDFQSKEDIKGYVSDVWGRCYPTATKRISRDNANYPKELFDFIEYEEHMGVKDFFIDVKDDEIVVTFKSTLKKDIIR